jgi:outer membrane receptor protein involved in Fe transport
VPLRWKGTSRLDWAWHGISTGITGYYFDGFHEPIFHPSVPSLSSHYVSQTWLFDVRASYTFNFAPETPLSTGPSDKDAKSVVNQTTATYELCSWKRLLNATTIAVGCNNVFGQDPPKASFAISNNYPDFLYDPTGRFVYASLTKKF